MNISIRPIIPGEREFTYSQEQAAMEQMGCIGYLRADMDSSGKGFYSTWNDFRTDLKTPAFKGEFDAVINALRFDDACSGILKDRDSLAQYCYSHPDTSYGNSREYGILVDTEDHAYYMRLNPHKGEYNLYCYCYKSSLLAAYIRDKRETHE
ncbi:hypothetical protein [Dysosmobacter sp.]|uniref:hypothetical protein n=1 Tax=Dysosmobacter sp. TaxID=2591382 RepID=UPI003AEFE58C